MSKNYFKGSVVLNPVPVVMVTSRNSEGKDNVFTVAWTGTVCTKPPMLSISIRPERLSYEYIKESMEFTINLPTRRLTKETDFCGVRSGRVVDKISEMKFTMKEGKEVNSPYIDECPVNIECKVKSIIPLGTHDLFIAEVLCSHIDKKLIDENGKIHFEWANLITYSHGEYFPVPKTPIGSFGYSVAKKATVERKKSEIKTEVKPKKKKNKSIEKSKKKGKR
ncbi:MAG: flavin reductase family protein [Candidatus Fusobacterium pullicola]|uniref:Flavin reductase family protein n=1 Tax=Candidatus Fusobacterium pullicola TaxID=2838601 RepID=A0A9E2NXD8_9FUSO|nr:flavin reductase family protein [Candidatus Fusobacterium pullicola]